MSEMQKFDSGKSRMDLIPGVLLEEVGNVLAFGAKKYSANNWRKGCDWSKFQAAALRHLTAWGQGETNDPESGINHLAHAICSLGFLLEYNRSNLGNDDRPVTDSTTASSNTANSNSTTWDNSSNIATDITSIIESIPKNPIRTNAPPLMPFSIAGGNGVKTGELSYFMTGSGGRTMFNELYKDVPGAD